MNAENEKSLDTAIKSRYDGQTKMIKEGHSAATTAESRDLCVITLQSPSLHSELRTPNFEIPTDQPFTQFSIFNPLTLLNSFSLFVTRTQPRLKAWAAISISLLPITFPLFSRPDLTSP